MYDANDEVMSCVYTCESFSSNCESLVISNYQSFCIIVSPIGRTVFVLYYCVINDNVEFLIVISTVVSTSILELFFTLQPCLKLSTFHSKVIIRSC